MTYKDLSDSIAIKLSVYSKPMLNVQEAAMFMGVSTHFVYKLMCAHVLPYSKPHGKLVYFDRNDLVRYMKKNHVMSDEEVCNEASRMESRSKKGGRK